jgi:hypothetical protein
MILRESEAGANLCLVAHSHETAFLCQSIAPDAAERFDEEFHSVRAFTTVNAIKLRPHEASPFCPYFLNF